jgi:CDP-diglyceride synthetase
MLITLGLSVWFYLAYSADPEDIETETSLLIDWIFIVLVITTLASLFFFIFHFVKQWRKAPKKIWQSTVGIVSMGLLLFITYTVGNGNPLSISGYKGSENTYIWLKLTDMWIYSIYILLALALIALLGGIVWSYLKKIK